MIYRIEANFLRTNDALARQQGRERRKQEKQDDPEDDHGRQREQQDAKALIDLVA